MIDQIINIEETHFEIIEKKDMYMITVAKSFVGYITKDGEYIGKSLKDSTIKSLKEVIL